MMVVYEHFAQEGQDREHISVQAILRSPDITL